MLQAILTILATIAKWFAPELMEKRLKAKLRALEEEKQKILEQPPTPALAKRLAKIETEITHIKKLLSQ